MKEFFVEVACACSCGLFMDANEFVNALVCWRRCWDERALSSRVLSWRSSTSEAKARRWHTRGIPEKVAAACYTVVSCGTVRRSIGCHSTSTAFVSSPCTLALLTCNLWPQSVVCSVVENLLGPCARTPVDVRICFVPQARRASV